MSEREVLETLIRAFSARDWIDQHANGIETGIDDCVPCMRRVGAVLRGMTVQESLPFACHELQAATNVVTTARALILAWNNGSTEVT